MEHRIRIGSEAPCCEDSLTLSPAVLWLQSITLIWMMVECAVSLYAAKTAHSVALLAFGSDSLVELLSASVVLLSFFPSFRVPKEQAARWAGNLLYVLAGIIVVIAVTSLVHGIRPETSRSGIAITIAALAIMPVLALSKRKLANISGNRALAADAVQSATCAYLAGITLLGLVANAVFHNHWIDPVAALAVLPILVVEGRKARQGESCG